MRGFQDVAALSFVTLAVGAKNLTLADVYGPATPPTQNLSWSQRSANRATRDFSTRVPENCIFPLEVVIIQDVTASFQDDFAIMAGSQLDAMVSALEAGHPDSKFSVVSHRDKPIWSLGEPKTDYCVTIESPLSSSVDDLKKVYNRLVSTGGGDPSESQFTAAIAAAQSATVGWGSMPAEDVTRIVVVATDSPPHFQGDGLNAYGMTPFSGTWDEANAKAQCLAEYYPTPKQFKDALAARETYAAFLVFDGSWWSELPRDAWKWVNSYIGQSAGFFEPLAEDSSNFWEVLARIIHEIEQLECVETSTTAPSTTTATTVAPTTATTVAPTTSTTILESTTTKTAAATPTVLESTTTSTTVASVTPVGTPQMSEPVDTTASECPTCPPCGDHCHDHCHEHDHCCHHCHHHCHCPCPEVEVNLRYKPKHLQLNVEN